MGIAQSSHYWVSRLAGNDPASPRGDYNTAWTLTSGSSGSVSGSAWRVTNQKWKYTIEATDNDLTLITAVAYTSTPNNGEMLMALDNGTHRVEVQASSDANKLNLVGATTVQTVGLDLSMTEDSPIPCILRLTLANDGTANLYMREIIEDDDAQQHYISVTGSSSSAQGAYFGNATGSVDWYTVYFTTFGAYSPDEMDMSDWVTNSLMQTGLSVVQTLKDSNRFYLKTHVTDAAIVYGYDLSSNAFVNRVQAPSVHVVTQKIQSPDFLTLAGKRTDQQYNVIVYITTRGTDYKNAYRQGLSIMGEVFDELYTQTGLQAGVDSITSYQADLDSKMDDDDVVCIHILTITYMKKVRMFMREV